MRRLQRRAQAGEASARAGQARAKKAQAAEQTRARAIHWAVLTTPANGLGPLARVAAAAAGDCVLAESACRSLRRPLPRNRQPQSRP
jgi:hypothetical protein